MLFHVSSTLLVQKLHLLFHFTSCAHSLGVSLSMSNTSSKTCPPSIHLAIPTHVTSPGSAVTCSSWGPLTVRFWPRPCGDLPFPWRFMTAIAPSVEGSMCPCLGVRGEMTCWAHNCLAQVCMYMYM